MYLRDIDIGACHHYRKIHPIEYAQFNKQASWLGSFYLRLLPKVKTNCIAKISVTACHSAHLHEKSISPMLDVVGVVVPFLFTRYWVLPKDDRKCLLLDAMNNGILEVCRTYGLPSDPFTRAHGEIRARSFHNEFFWKKMATSPDRKYTAHILISYEPEDVTLHLIVKNKNGSEVKRCFLRRTEPHEIHFFDYLGKIKWLDRGSVALFSKEGEQKMECSLSCT